jgi:hypothetical protein
LTIFLSSSSWNKLIPIEWALVGPSFTRENKLLIFLVFLARVTPQRPLFFGYSIAKNQNKPGKKQSFENVNNPAIFTMDCDCPSWVFERKRC